MSATFSTQRLVIHELSSPIAGKDRQPLLKAALNILTPNVVQQLPNYFHNIVSEQDADLWYQKMLCESRMLVIKTHDTQQLIGFIFAYTDGRHAHIGYLLAENYWRQGLAKEALSGFINWAKTHRQWDTLIAGVGADNIGSCKLLLKLGFVRTSSADDESLFYQLALNPEHKSR